MTSILKDLWDFIYLHTWDLGLVFINLLTPKIKKGAVYKEGDPGYNGLWPEFIPPNPEKDSRSPCPALNAMANHGILPRDGKNITMPFLVEKLVKTWNLSPTFCWDTCNAVVKLYRKDVIDLGDLSRHNAIEHDASMFRKDAYFNPDQSTPDKELITRFLQSASGPITSDYPQGRVTPTDIANFLSQRVAESKRDNPEYSLSFLHSFFMYSNASVYYEIMGGDVETGKSLLLRERIPEGFESFMRERMGHTMARQYSRIAQIRFSGSANPKLGKSE